MTDVEVEVETWGEGGVAYVAFDGSEEGAVGKAGGDAVDEMRGCEVYFRNDDVLNGTDMAGGGGADDDVAFFGKQVLEIEMDAGEEAFDLRDAVGTGEFELLIDDALTGAEGIDIRQRHFLSEKHACENAGLEGHAWCRRDVDAPLER